MSHIPAYSFFLLSVQLLFHLSPVFNKTLQKCSVTRVVVYIVRIFVFVVDFKTSSSLFLWLSYVLCIVQNTVQNTRIFQHVVKQHVTLYVKFSSILMVRSCTLYVKFSFILMVRSCTFYIALFQVFSFSHSNNFCSKTRWEVGNC